jgi:DNA-binding response OmpR family regulator
LADLLAKGLSDQGIAADVAYDGTEAASKLGVNAYDVVVLDRNLPGIPGDTVCQMISGSDDRTMVLMLSGAASPADRTSGLGLGADDYLVKPFHFPELVLRVRALARRRPRAQPRALRASGVELDCLRRTVTRQGRPVVLSAKELGRAGPWPDLAKSPRGTGRGPMQPDRTNGSSKGLFGACHR